MSVVITPKSPELAPRARAGLTSAQRFALALLAAATISAVSLVAAYAIGFDPAGWIVYAREVFGPGALDTSRNPAWKPLPVMVVGVFSLVARGQTEAYFWLFCARMLGVLLVLGAARLAGRYAGRWAALLTAVLIVASPWWLANATLGADGPVTGALAVGGVLAYQRGWVRAAGLCAIGASLLRPEAGAFTLVFGIWAWRRGEVSIWELLGALAMLAGLWAVPNVLHSGYGPAAIASRGGVKGTPIRTAFPVLAVLTQSVGQLLAIPSGLVAVAAGAVLARLAGRRRPRLRPRLRWLAALWGRSREELVLLGVGVAWLAMIALETLDGFSGNTRYAICAYVMFSVVAGVVAVRLVSAGRRAWPLAVPPIVAAVAIATGAMAIGPLRAQHRLIAIRVRELPRISALIKVLHCPGYVGGDHASYAYVAMLVHQSLPDSDVPFSSLAHRPVGAQRVVFCAPAGWRPHSAG